MHAASRPLARRVCRSPTTPCHATSGLAAQMRAASHTYSRVGCAARFPDLACNGRALAAEMRAASHTYSLRVRCSLSWPCLRRQGSPLRCLPHHEPTRVGCASRLLRPAYDGRACCSDACRITHLLSRRVRCSLNTPCLCSRARCSDACRITHLLSRRVALLAYLALPATAELALRCMPYHTPTLA